MYWVDYTSLLIQTCNLQGQDIRNIATLSEASRPWGLANRGDRIFVGSYGSSKLQSMTISGEDVRTLYDGTSSVNQLVVASDNLRRNRTNRCDSLNCSRICVLTATSARCLY